MSDADFHTGTRDQTLGDKKAGSSADLDALSAYVSSLSTEPTSPFRGSNGELKAAAIHGKALFESTELGCTTCHAGTRLTDSTFVTPTEPLLHDVGTLSPLRASASASRSPASTRRPCTECGARPLICTTARPHLRDVVRTKNPLDCHGKTSQLSDADIDDLVSICSPSTGRTSRETYLQSSRLTESPTTSAARRPPRRIRHQHRCGVARGVGEEKQMIAVGAAGSTSVPARTECRSDIRRCGSPRAACSSTVERLPRVEVFHRASKSECAPFHSPHREPNPSCWRESSRPRMERDG